MLALSQFRAVLGDSIREAIDRKSIYVLLVLSTLCIIFCLGASFQVTEKDELLKTQVDRLLEIESTTFGRHHFTNLGGEFKLLESKSDGPLDPDKEQGFDLTTRFEQERQLDSMVQYQKAHWRSPWRKKEEPKEPDVATPEERAEALQQKWMTQGWDRAKANPTGDPLVWNIRLETNRLRDIPGAYKQSLFFGLMTTNMKDRSVAEAVVGLQTGIVGGFFGVIGMLIIIFSCAGFVPSMLTKGSLDLILARPISRSRLLLFKYIGGMSMITLVSIYLVGGCWLALALRTGFTNPAFLASILVEVAVFAVIYAILVLFGVWTRSGTVAGMLTIGVWWASAAVTNLNDVISVAPEQFKEWNATIVKAINALYYLLPNTTHISNLNMEILSRAHLSEEAAERMREASIAPVDWWVSGGTTAAFTIVMLGLATWMFKRRDY